MHRSMRALAGALVLALAIVPSAFAGTITESLSVNSIITVTGIPATINYGAVDPGQQSPTQSFTASVTANSGYIFKMSGSNFTGTGSINKTARFGRFGGSSNATINAASVYTDFGATAFDGSTTIITGNAGSSSFNTDLYIAVPGAQAPGAYTGTITYTFTAS